MVYIKNYIFNHFYLQCLVLLTMVPRNSSSIEQLRKLGQASMYVTIFSSAIDVPAFTILAFKRGGTDRGTIHCLHLVVSIIRGDVAEFIMRNDSKISPVLKNLFLCRHFDYLYVYFPDDRSKPRRSREIVAGAAEDVVRRSVAAVTLLKSSLIKVYRV